MASSKKLDNILIPEHEIITDDEIKVILSEYKIDKKNLPKIFLNDPIIKRLGAKEGDVIKITRNELDQQYFYYRLVV